jgi:hypothetical protein
MCLSWRELFSQSKSESTSESTGTEKYQAIPKISIEEIFDFAFQWTFVPTMKNLQKEIGRKKFNKMLEDAAIKKEVELTKQWAESLPENDFKTFKMNKTRMTALMKDPGEFWPHVITSVIEEDTDTLLSEKVTGCLFAKTFPHRCK